MKNIVVGTAGHIDHGKTALVRALTGIDTDRLEEEKRRGISIDLGFAHLDLGDGIRLAFIDVPGHERFIKNMLAGAAGIDAVVLVVAADESVKPQTREHFEICRLLRIPRGIIALTKVDLVDSDIVELVRLEVDEFVAGSFLEGAPVIPVSAQTGEGLAELRQALRNIVGEVEPKDTQRYFRLPVDRSFVVQGFGTVVTGTVIAGRISLEEEVQVHPGAATLRVRGIEVHGEQVKQAAAGQRAALNLAGTSSAEIRRGAVLATPDRFRPASRFDAMFELLESAKPLKNRSPIHFHTGTAEEVAEIRTLDGSQAIAPGTISAVRIVLREPLVLVPGDRFVVRRFSPVLTVGGGQVIDADPPATIKPPHSAERTRLLDGASAAERIAMVIAESGSGLSIDDLVLRTGFTIAAIEQAVPKNVLRLSTPVPWFIDREWLTRTLAAWRKALSEYHRQNPLSPGLKREELRSRELPGAPPFVFDAVLAQDPAIVASGEVVHLDTHKVAFKEDEEQALGRIERAFEDAGLLVPGLKEVLASSGVDPARARSLLQILFRNKRLVKVSEELVFHPAALSQLRELLSSRRGVRFSVPEFKDWTGISRKYAIPLLEFLDREHVTRRDGDARLIL